MVEVSHYDCSLLFTSGNLIQLLGTIHNLAVVNAKLHMQLFKLMIEFQVNALLHI